MDHSTAEHTILPISGANDFEVVDYKEVQLEYRKYLKGVYVCIEPLSAQISLERDTQALSNFASSLVTSSGANDFEVVDYKEVQLEYRKYLKGLK